jgi:hypothetical protein
MNPKKKSRRCRGLGLDSGLDLAISRFIYSFGFKVLSDFKKVSAGMWSTLPVPWYLLCSRVADPDTKGDSN